MNELNRIFHNKPVKFFYFVRNFVRYAVPRPLLQRRLDEVLSEVERRSDRDYILQRVSYYNRLPEGATLPVERSKPLGEHRFGKGVRTAYFFDSYEFTRWFDDALRWNMIPGDVTQVPDIPSVVKSRPIAGDNANSVLLNLDKFRHFVFLRDDIPFREKEDRAIFRCAINCHHPNHHLRRRFMERYYGSACCDAGISNRHASLPPEWTKPHISMYDHLRYRYILTIEGNDVATNLKWVMSTNSLPVMPRADLRDLVHGGDARPELPLCRNPARLRRSRGVHALFQQPPRAGRGDDPARPRLHPSVPRSAPRAAHLAAGAAPLLRVYGAAVGRISVSFQICRRPLHKTICHETAHCRR